MMQDFSWRPDVEAARVADLGFFPQKMRPIYNRYAECPAYVLYRLVSYIHAHTDTELVLKPMEHICYLWGLNKEDEPDESWALIDARFHDSGLLLELLVPAETVPLEQSEWPGGPIPVFRKDNELPEHPAVSWFLEVVRWLETPPRLEVHSLLTKEVFSTFIWNAAQEIGDGLAALAALRGEPFPRSPDEVQEDLERLGKRFAKMAGSTQMSRLNLQADIVCLAVQILLRCFAPEDDLRWPWMVLLQSLGTVDPAFALRAARAKVQFLVAHPEYATFPTRNAHIVWEAIWQAVYH